MWFGVPQEMNEADGNEVSGTLPILILSSIQIIFVRSIDKKVKL